MSWHGIDCSGKRWGQLQSTYKYGNEPSGSIKCGTFLNFSRRTLLHRVNIIFKFSIYI